MLPQYNPNRKPLTRWERFTSWLEDAEPYIVIFCIIGAIYLFFALLMPKCPKCDTYIHPMYNYCAKLMALYDVQVQMRQNYGESPDVWCKNVWQYVYDEIEKLTNHE